MALNLVVQTAFLGDLLLSIPLLKRCRAQWPEDRLGLVCRKGFGDFFLKTKLVDEIYEIEKGKSDSYSKILKSLKSEKVNYLVSPHESLRTLFFCVKVNANEKVSFKKSWNGFFFTQRIQKNSKLPDSMRQLSLLSLVSSDLERDLKKYSESPEAIPLKASGLLSAPPSWASMSLRQEVLANTSLYENLKQKFDLQNFEKGKTVLLFPGSVWRTKRWTEEGYIELGRSLKLRGHEVIVMGGPGEEELAERVAQNIPGVVSLAGKMKVIESAQLIARAALVVGNDSASTHLAAVCETPLVAIFGPTVLEFGFRPWSKSSYVVQPEGLACRPCGKHGHQQCPLGTHACMKNISAKEVLSQAEIILR